MTYSQTTNLLRGLAAVFLIYAVLAITAAVAGAGGELFIVSGAERPVTGNEEAGGEPVAMAVQVAEGTDGLTSLVWWSLSGVVAGAGGLAFATGALVLDVRKSREREEA